MTEFASSKEDLVSALRRYMSALEQRRDLLVQLAATSAQMHSTLRSDSTADIQAFLDQREAECRHYAELCDRLGLRDETLVEVAERAALSGGELGRLACAAVAMHADSQSLAQEILQRQTECETILRTRLQATAKALRESKQRRKLDAAYGPAHKRDTPVFLDKQQ